MRKQQTGSPAALLWVAAVVAVAATLPGCSQESSRERAIQVCMRDVKAHSRDATRARAECEQILTDKTGADHP